MSLVREDPRFLRTLKSMTPGTGQMRSVSQLHRRAVGRPHEAPLGGRVHRAVGGRLGSDVVKAEGRGTGSRGI